jgi:hypothetical protein
MLYSQTSKFVSHITQKGLMSEQDAMLIFHVIIIEYSRQHFCKSLYFLLATSLIQL